MATTGIVNGHNLRFFLAGTAIGQATSCSISFSAETRDTAHKDVGGPTGWADVETGQLSWTGTCDALYSEAQQFETLYTAFAAGTAVTVQYSTDVTGDKYFYGSALVTALDMNADNNENVTYTVSFTGKGAPTRATVT